LGKLFYKRKRGWKKNRGKKNDHRVVPGNEKKRKKGHIRATEKGNKKGMDSTVT